MEKKIIAANKENGKVKFVLIGKCPTSLELKSFDDIKKDITNNLAVYTINDTVVRIESQFKHYGNFTENIDVLVAKCSDIDLVQVLPTIRETFEEFLNVIE